MIRQVTLEEISDGKLYGLNDMVKADCHDCKGCSSCCKGMGTSIILDPLDIFHLMSGLKFSFEQLLTMGVELNVVDGLILPNLKMDGVEEACSFLDENGRCKVHGFRPSICRLFPLGRYYEGDKFQYFLQTHECEHKNRSKVKVRKWIDTPELEKNQDFINEWHRFVRDLQEEITRGMDENLVKQISMYCLKLFFMAPYQMDVSFYEQFEKRMNMVKEAMGR